VQRTIVIFVLLMELWGFSFPVFANSLRCYKSDFNLPIPSDDKPKGNHSKGWMKDAIINVTDHILISDLNVNVNLTHTNVIDLQIFLKGPDKTKICLNMFDVYNLDDFPRDQNYKDYINTVFDDEADTFIKGHKAPFTGRFKPIKPFNLSVFDNHDAYGPWRLQVYDAFYADTGRLNSFELIITTPTPEPATAILLILGAGFIHLRNRLSHFRNI